MPELPAYMIKGGRPPDQSFTPEEMLYRRVPPDFWDDDEIELDGIDLPDMSVTREKYGPPEACRWEFYKYLSNSRSRNCDSSYLAHFDIKTVTRHPSRGKEGMKCGRVEVG
jgi:hypothetical protein